MSKYTAQAHDERRNSIQTLRDIMRDSYNTNSAIAKTIGRLSIIMPRTKKDFLSINAYVDYLTEEETVKLINPELQAQWITTCESLKG